MNRILFPAIIIYFILNVNILIGQAPPPLEGFHWETNPEFTDEFDGDTLDDTKWYDRSPY